MVHVGDVVQTPHGDQPIVEIDNARDMILTQNPKTKLVLEWPSVEIEEIVQPDPRDTEAVERWLKVAAVIIPSLNVETTTIRCVEDCPCRHCYRIVKRLSARGVAPRVEVTHFRDNDTCGCDKLAMSDHWAIDCGCMETVNFRWNL